jgi:hypothetical protein
LDYWGYWKGTFWQKMFWAAQVISFLCGCLVIVGGTYGTVKQIVQAYADGTIGKAFDCADNSNSS